MGTTFKFPQEEVQPIRKESLAADYLTQPNSEKVNRIRRASPTFQGWKIDHQLEFVKQLDTRLRERAAKPAAVPPTTPAPKPIPAPKPAAARVPVAPPAQPRALPVRAVSAHAPEAFELPENFELLISQGYTPDQARALALKEQRRKIGERPEGLQREARGLVAEQKRLKANAEEARRDLNRRVGQLRTESAELDNLRLALSTQQDYDSFNERVDFHNLSVGELQRDIKAYDKFDRSPLRGKVQAYQREAQKLQADIEKFNNAIIAARAFRAKPAPAPERVEIPAYGMPGATAGRIPPKEAAELPSAWDRVVARASVLLDEEQMDWLKRKVAVDPEIVELLAREVEREGKPQRVPMFGIGGMAGMGAMEVSPQERGEAVRSAGVFARAAMDSLNQWYSPLFMGVRGLGAAAGYAARTGTQAEMSAWNAMGRWRQFSDSWARATNAAEKVRLKAFADSAQGEYLRAVSKTQHFLRLRLATQAANAALGTSFAVSGVVQGMDEMDRIRSEGREPTIPESLMAYGPPTAIAFLTLVNAAMVPHAAKIRAQLGYKPGPFVPLPGPRGLAGAPPVEAPPPVAPGVLAAAPAAAPEAPRPAPRPTAPEEPSGWLEGILAPPVEPPPTVPPGRPNLNNAIASPMPGEKWADYLINRTELADSKEGVDHYKAGDEHYIVMPSGDVFTRQGAAGEKEFKRAVRWTKRYAEKPEATRAVNAQEAQRIIEEAGLKWVGPQEGPGREVTGYWFTDPETRSSLLLRPEEVTPERVRAKTKESRRGFAKAPTTGQAPEAPFSVGDTVDYRTAFGNIRQGEVAAVEPIRGGALAGKVVWQWEIKVRFPGNKVESVSARDLQLVGGPEPAAAPRPERRLDRELRAEVEEHMRLSGETDREAALRDVLQARREVAEPERPLGKVPEPTVPVPPEAPPSPDIPPAPAPVTPETIQRIEGGTFKHFTTPESKAALESGELFDFTREPVFGTGGLGLEPRMGRIAGTGKIYLSLDDAEWTKARKFEGGGENVEATDENIAKGHSYYDYDKQKWMVNIGGFRDLWLDPVEFQIAPTARVLTIGSEKEFQEALHKADQISGKSLYWEDAEFWDALAKEYDAVAIRNVSDALENDPDNNFFKAAMADQVVVLNPKVATIVRPPELVAAPAPEPIGTTPPSAALHKPEYMTPGTAVVVDTAVGPQLGNLRNVGPGEGQAQVQIGGASVSANIGEVTPIWAMPRAEVLKIPGASGPMHEWAVTLAFQAGQPVPQEVLADYPELKPEEPTPIAAPPPAEPAPEPTAAEEILPRDIAESVAEHVEGRLGSAEVDRLFGSYSGLVDRALEAVESQISPKPTLEMAERIARRLMEERPAELREQEEKIEYSKELKPVSEVKFSPKRAFNGDLSLAPEFITDGRNVIKASAIQDEKLLAKIREIEPETSARKITREEIEGIWASKAQTTGVAIEPLGYHEPKEKRGTAWAYYVPREADEPLVGLQPERVELIKRLTGADELRATTGEEAVVFLRAGEPVALLMGMRNPEDKLDVPTARAAARGLAPVPAPAPEPLKIEEKQARSWIAGIKTSTDPDFVGSAARFATEAEAEKAGQELAGRWFAVKEWKALPDYETAPNYRFNFEDYRAERIEVAPAKPPMSPEKAAALAELKAALSEAPPPIEPGDPAKMAFSPKVIGALKKYGDLLYREGVTEYAAWSNQVISDLGAMGERARPYLQFAWDYLQAAHGGEAIPAAPKKEPTAEVGKQERVKQLTRVIFNRIQAGDAPRDWKDLQQMAKASVGGNPGEYVDDIYDALEGAFNLQRVLAERESPVAGLSARVSKADTLEDALPRRVRTIEITERQQFSTPFPLAEGVQYAGDIKGGEVVWEPTAGTGNLVAPLLARPDVNVRVNEIDPRRAAVLEIVGFPDVEALDYIHAEGRKADVILMNPPWGAKSTGRYENINIPSPWGPLFHDISERFFVKALRDLNPGGRVSALMPTTILKAAGFLKWLRENHTVRAIIQSPPDAYLRRGTKVDSVLLVVDKGSVEGAPAAIVRTLANAPKTWDDWVEALKPLAEGGSHAKTAPAVAPLGAPTPGGERPGPPHAGVAGPGAPGEYVGPVRAPAVAAPGPAGPPGVAPAEGARPAIESLGEARLVRRTSEVLLGLTANLAPERRREFEDANASEIFVPYVPRQDYGYAPAAQLHPRQTIETRSLAGVPYPELRVNLGPTLTEALNENRISLEQADGIAALVQANLRGHSMLLADDTGVGKSREAVGAAIEFMERGLAGPKNKVLYISGKTINLHDVVKEMKILLGLDVDTGKLPFHVIFLRDYKNSKELAGKQRPWEPLPDVPNAFYMVEAGNIHPYQKAILEAQFGAVIADEVHNLRNVEGAQRGMTWRHLADHWMERNIPIGMFTATPAQRIDDIEYLYPLREWTIDGFLDFVDRVTGRLTADQVKERQERQQRERRADRKAINYIQSLETPEHQEFAGLYWRGLLGNLPSSDFMRFQVMQPKFPSTLLDPLNQIYQEGYRRPADIRTATTQAPAAPHQGARRQRRERGDVFSRDVSTAELEQIMRELKMVGKYRSIDIWRGGLEFEQYDLKLTPEEEQQWYSAVKFIRDCMDAYDKFKGLSGKQQAGTINSMAQFAIKRILAHFRLKRGIPLAKELLASGHQVIFAIEFVSEVDPSRGHIGAIIHEINEEIAIRDPHTGDVIDIDDIPEALRLKTELRERALKEIMPLPSPLEEIRDAFGAENVADLSGKVDVEDRMKYMADFQSGIRRVGIMSPASSEGINLDHVTWIDPPENHTGPWARGRRAVVMVDFKWSAELFKQSVLGRADRSGQLSSPKIYMQTLGMAAEQKFIATLANRLKDVGAIAKGAAESVGAQPLMEFEMGGNVDLLAMRDAWYRDYITEDDKNWFRGDLFKDVIRIGDQVFTRPTSDIRRADLKHFFLQVQLMPRDVGNRVTEAFFRRREELWMAQNALDNIALETQKGDGEVTRVRQLQPDLQLYEAKDKQNRRFGILVGMITDKAAIIRPMLPDRGRFIYLTFRDKGGEPISGLRIARDSIEAVAKRLGTKELLKHTPETALDDLRAGDKIPLANGWALYLGRAGAREGKIVIEGAGMLNTDRGQAVKPHGGAYLPSGNLFVVLENRLQDFLKRFPIAVELSERAGQEADPAYERIWPNEPSAEEIKRRMPVTDGLTADQALAAWRRAMSAWVKMTEASTPVGDPYYIFNEGGVFLPEEVKKVTDDPKWAGLADAVKGVVEEIAQLGLPQGYSVSRTGLMFPAGVGSEEEPITFGANLVDPIRAQSAAVVTNVLAAIEAAERIPGMYPGTTARDFARTVLKNLFHEVAHVVYRSDNDSEFWKFLNKIETSAPQETVNRWWDRLTRAIAGGEGNEPGQFLYPVYRRYLEARGRARRTGRSLIGGPTVQLGVPGGPYYQRNVPEGGAPPPGGGGGAEPPVPRGAPEPEAAPTGARAEIFPTDVRAYIRRLYDINVRQHLKTTGETLKEFGRDVVALVAPRYLAPEESKTIIMRMKGWSDEVLQRLMLVDAGLVTMFEEMPKAYRIQFWDRFRHGEKQETQELEEVADFIQRTGDSIYKTVLWEQIQDIRELTVEQKKQSYSWAIANLRRIAPLFYGEAQPRTKLEASMVALLADRITPYLSEHLRAFWKEIPGSLKPGPQGIEQVARGRRPLQGSKGWMRRHTLPDLSSGIEDGGVPVTDNPIIALNMDVRDHMRFAAARRAWRELKAAGRIKYFRNRRDAPEGMNAEIKDRIAEVYFPLPDGGWSMGGHWFTDPDTARLFNNFLSVDRIRSKAWGRALVTVVMATKSWELSFSAFHAIFETGMVMAGQAGIGLSRIFNLGVPKFSAREIAKGLETLAMSPLAPVRYFREGRRLIRYVKARDPIIKLFKETAHVENDPVTEDWLRTLFQEGGGQLKMHEDYRVTAVRGLRDSIESDDYVRSILYAIPSIFQTMMSPMFDVMIPAYKLGYARELYLGMMAEYEDDIREGRITKTEIARRSWDQVENMLGEMNFDNLFWNRTFKTTLQMYFRSVTWWMGSGRTFGLGFYRQTREFLGIVEKRRLPSGRPALPAGERRQLPSSTTEEPLDTARQLRAGYRFRFPKLDSNMAAILGMMFMAAVISGIYILLKKRTFQGFDWSDVVGPGTGDPDEKGRIVNSDIASVKKNPDGTISVVTATPHGAVDGELIRIRGNTAGVNKTYRNIRVVNPNTVTFELGLGDEWMGVAPSGTGGKATVFDKEVRLRPPHEFWVQRSMLLHPLEAAKAARTGFWVKLSEAIDNRDFFGEYVYDPDDPFVSKSVDFLAQIAGIPMSYSVMEQAKRRAASPSEEVLSYFGWRRVPLDFAIKPDEKLALELLKRRGEREPLTHKEADLRQEVGKAMRAYRGEKMTEDELINLAERGVIDPGSVRRILTSGDKPWIFRLFLALKADEKIAVWKLASPAHKAALVEVFHVPMRQARSTPEPEVLAWEDEMEKLVREAEARGEIAAPAPVPIPRYTPPRPAPQPVAVP